MWVVPIICYYNIHFQLTHDMGWVAWQRISCVRASVYMCVQQFGCGQVVHTVLAKCMPVEFTHSHFIAQAAQAHTMCTRPFLSSKGLGMRLQIIYM